jgi:hypothetical protein
VLIQLGAGSLSALCFAFSWRAYRHCRAITNLSHATEAPPTHETESFEQRLAEREANAALNLATRNVKGLAQAAFTGGLALAFLALTGGRSQHQEAMVAFTLGSVGAIACLALRRRIGSWAEVWRDATNKRLRRQGVDQPERTG